MDSRRVAILGSASHTLAAAVAAQLMRGNHDRVNHVGLGDSIHGGTIIYDVEPVPAVRPQQEMAASPPDSISWRNNLLPTAEIAASPLPTRQLKRMAARALARAMSSAQRIEGRQEKRLSKKRTRALAAAEAHAHIQRLAGSE